jgi:RNA polymerase sigma-70 factor, ECF subfamily
MMTLKRSNDAHVVRQVLGGDRTAFGTLVERYSSYVYGVAYAHLRNQADAEDVTQDVFLSAFKSLHTLRERARFGRWLVTLAKNRSRDVLKRRRVAEAAPEKMEAQPVRPSPEREEVHALLREQLATLDDDDREVLVLHYFSGSKAREVAALLGISRAAASKRIQRARAALGERLVTVLGDDLTREERPRERNKRLMGLVAGAPVLWEASGSAAAATVAGGTFTAATLGKLSLAGVVLAVVLTASFVALRDNDSPSVALADEKPVTLPDAQPGNLDITVTSAALRSEPVDTTEARESEPAAAESASLAADIGVVRGVVIDPRGQPVVGARVTLERRQSYAPWLRDLGPYRRTLSTDASGAFRFDAFPLLFHATDKAGIREYVLSAELGNLCCQANLCGHHIFRETFVELALHENAFLAGQVVDSRGMPVAGARVAVRDMTPTATISRYSIPDPVATDSDGQFRYTHLLPGAYKLAIQGLETPSYETNRDDILVKMDPGATVSCQLVEEDSGNALPGLEVFFEGCGAQETNEDGFVIFPGVSEGDYVVFPQKGPYVLASGRETIAVTDSATPLDVRLMVRHGATLSGRVLDAGTGEPVAGVRIGASVERASYSIRGTESEADGTFRLEGLSVGAYNVHASIGFTELSEAQIEVQSLDADMLADIRVGPIAHVRGRVVNESGAPLGLASVMLQPADGKRPETAFTDEDGGFEARICEDQGGILVQALHAAGVSETVGPLDPTKQSLGDLVLTVSQGGRIQGRVVGLDSAGVAGTYVTVAPTAPSAANLFPVDVIEDFLAYGHCTTSPSIGVKTQRNVREHFALGPLVPGTYAVAAYAHGRMQEVPIASTTVSLAPGESIGDLLLTCGPGEGAAVEGFVTLNGAPCAGQRVRWDAVRDTGHVESDEEGRFRITGLASGHMTLTCRKIAQEDGFDVTHETRQSLSLDGADTVTVNLDLITGDGTIEGRVAVNGEPAEDAYLYVKLLPYPSPQKTSTRTNGAGDYRMSGLVPGVYHVYMLKSLGDPAGDIGVSREAEVEVVNGQTVRLDFRVQTGFFQGSLSGLRAGEGGIVAVVPGEVTVDRIDAETLAVLERETVAKKEMAEPGPFAFADIAPGLYTVFYAAYPAAEEDTATALAQARCFSILVEIQEGQTTEAVLVLE